MDPSVYIQKQMKDNAEELQTYALDLDNWRNQMNRVEKTLKDNIVANEGIPPVRSKPSSTLKENDSDRRNSSCISSWLQNTFNVQNLIISAANIEKERNENELFFGRWDCNGIESCWRGLSEQNGNSDSNSNNPEYKRQQREKSLFEKERGNEAVKKCRYVDAILHYTEAISCYSTDATFYANRAFCFLKRNQLREAETDCTTALQLDRTYVKAYHRRAQARVKLNQISEACDDLRKGLEFDPDNVVLQNDLKMYSAKIPLKTKIDVKQSKAATIEKPVVHKSQKGIFDTKSQVEEHDEKKVDDEAKKEAYTIKEKGNALVKKKQWQEASDCYTSAIDIYSEDDVFYANRALCFLKMHRPKSALLDCTKAIEINKSNFKAYHRKGLALKVLGQFEEAHTSLLKALELDIGNQEIEQEILKVDQLLSSTRDKPAGVTVNNLCKRKPDNNKKNGHDNIKSIKPDSKPEVKKCKYNEDVPSLDVFQKKIDELAKSVENFPEYLRCEEKEFDKDEMINTIKKMKDYTEKKDTAKISDLPENLKSEEKKDKNKNESFGFKFVFESDKKKPNSNDAEPMEAESDNKSEGVKKKSSFGSFNPYYLKTGFTAINAPDVASQDLKKVPFVKVPVNEVTDDSEDPYLNYLKIYNKETIQIKNQKPKSDSEKPSLRKFVDTFISDKGIQHVGKDMLPVEHDITTLNHTTSQQQRSDIDMLKGSINKVRSQNVASTYDKSSTESKIKLDILSADNQKSDNIPVNIAPKSYFQFSKQWRLLEKDPFLKYQYLKLIDGHNFPHLFQESLDSTVFSQIIEILSSKFIEHGEPVYAYLFGLSKINRFDFIILFSSPEDKLNITKIFEHCQHLKECTPRELSTIKEKYKI